MNYNGPRLSNMAELHLPEGQRSQSQFPNLQYGNSSSSTWPWPGKGPYAVNQVQWVMGQGQGASKAQNQNQKQKNKAKNQKKKSPWKQLSFEFMTSGTKGLTHTFKINDPGAWVVENLLDQQEEKQQSFLQSVSLLNRMIDDGVEGQQWKKRASIGKFPDWPKWNADKKDWNPNDIINNNDWNLTSPSTLQVKLTSGTSPDRMISPSSPTWSKILKESKTYSKSVARLSQSYGGDGTLTGQSSAASSQFPANTFRLSKKQKRQLKKQEQQEQNQLIKERDQILEEKRRQKCERLNLLPSFTRQDLAVYGSHGVDCSLRGSRTPDQEQYLDDIFGDHEHIWEHSHGVSQLTTGMSFNESNMSRGAELSQTMQSQWSWSHPTLVVTPTWGGNWQQQWQQQQQFYWAVSQTWAEIVRQSHAQLAEQQNQQQQQQSVKQKSLSTPQPIQPSKQVSFEYSEDQDDQNSNSKRRSTEQSAFESILEKNIQRAIQSMSGQNFTSSQVQQNQWSSWEQQEKWQKFAQQKGGNNLDSGSSLFPDSQQTINRTTSWGILDAQNQNGQYYTDEEVFNKLKHPNMFKQAQRANGWTTMWQDMAEVFRHQELFDKRHIARFMKHERISRESQWGGWTWKQQGDRRTAGASTSTSSDSDNLTTNPLKRPSQSAFASALQSDISSSGWDEMLEDEDDPIERQIKQLTQKLRARVPPKQKFKDTGGRFTHEGQGTGLISWQSYYNDDGLNANSSDDEEDDNYKPLIENPSILNHAVALIVPNPDHEDWPENFHVGREMISEIFQDLFPRNPVLQAWFERSWEYLRPNDGKTWLWNRWKEFVTDGWGNVMGWGMNVLEAGKNVITSGAAGVAGVISQSPMGGSSPASSTAAEVWLQKNLVWQNQKDGAQSQWLSDTDQSDLDNNNNNFQKKLDDDLSDVVNKDKKQKTVNFSPDSSPVLGTGNKLSVSGEQKQQRFSQNVRSRLSLPFELQHQWYKPKSTFLPKNFSHGGSMVKQEDGTFRHHVDDDLNCLDVLTLIRNTIVFVLVYECDFTVDLIFSPDYKDIYILVIPDDDDLKRQAEYSHFLCPVSWDRCDVESFEPTDHKYVPLIDRFTDDCDREILLVYRKMVKVFQQHWQNVPPEIVRFHLKKCILIDKWLHDKQLRQSQQGYLEKKVASGAGGGGSGSGGSKTAWQVGRHHKVPNQLRTLYLWYLKKRIEGLTPLRWMFEVNQEDGISTHEKLQNLWDRLQFPCGPAYISMHYSTMHDHIPWCRYDTENINGDVVRTHFSPQIRLQLIFERIERFLDLPDMILRSEGYNYGYLVDYFPLDDAELKELWFISFEEYVLRGDFRRQLQDKQSRYYFPFGQQQDAMCWQLKKLCLWLDDLQEDYRELDNTRLFRPGGEFISTPTNAKGQSFENIFEKLRWNEAQQQELEFAIEDCYSWLQIHQYQQQQWLPRVHELLQRNYPFIAEVQEKMHAPNLQQVEKTVKLKPGSTKYMTKVGIEPWVKRQSLWYMWSQTQSEANANAFALKHVHSRDTYSQEEDNLNNKSHNNNNFISDTVSQNSSEGSQWGDLMLTEMHFKKSPFMTRFLSNKCEFEYFGGQIGLYFMFLRHFTSNMQTPAMFGFVCTVIQILAEVSENKTFMKIWSEGLIVVNAIFLAVWAPLYIQSWEGMEKRKLLQLYGILPQHSSSGTKSNYKSSKHPMKRFIGKWIKSPITGGSEVSFSLMEKRFRLFISNTMTGLWFSLVIFIVIVVSSLREYFHEYTNIQLGEFKYNYSQNVIAGINGMLILVFNKVYAVIGLYLTRYENHRTYTQFNESYWYKTCMFQFLNCYSPLIYVWFVKDYLYPNTDMDLCPANNTVLGFNCELALTNRQLWTLIVVFCGRNVMELFLPWWEHQVMLYKQKSKKAEILKRQQQQAEEEQQLSAAAAQMQSDLLGGSGSGSSSLEDHIQKQKSNWFWLKWIDAKKRMAFKDVVSSSLVHELEQQRCYPCYGDATLGFDGTIEDYSELWVMFGFLILFSITFPLVAVLIYGASLMEVYVDTFKFKNLIRRPFPVQCVHGVGIWSTIFKQLVWLSIFINWWLLIATAKLHRNPYFQYILGTGQQTVLGAGAQMSGSGPQQGAHFNQSSSNFDVDNIINSWGQGQFQNDNNTMSAFNLSSTYYNNQAWNSSFGIINGTFNNQSQQMMQAQQSGMTPAVEDFKKEDSLQTSAWFMVMFCLGVLKMSVSDTQRAKDHDFDQAVQRIELQVDALLLPHLTKSKTIGQDSDYQQEDTDFRIQEPQSIQCQ